MSHDGFGFIVRRKRNRHSGITVAGNSLGGAGRCFQKLNKPTHALNVSSSKQASLANAGMTLVTGS